MLLLYLSRSEETLPISAVEGRGASYVICGTCCKLRRLDSLLTVIKGNFKRGTTAQSVGQGPLLASRAAFGTIAPVLALQRSASPRVTCVLKASVSQDGAKIPCPVLPWLFSFCSESSDP